MNEKKVLLYISMSLDGFIAAKDDDLSWLSIVQNGDEDYGYAEMMKGTDTYIVGNKTYHVIRSLTGGEFPQAKTHQCYIVTRGEQTNKENITFYNGDLKNLIQQLKVQGGKDIYCDGGGTIVQLLMKDNLIDEYIISVIPVILGDGIRLFKGGIEGIAIEHVETKSFSSGLVQMRYQKK